MTQAWDSRTDDEVIQDWLAGDWDPYRQDERVGIRATIPQYAWVKSQRTGWDVVADAIEDAAVWCCNAAVDFASFVRRVGQ